MSKWFNLSKLKRDTKSPITYVYGGNLEECHKVIADLEAKLAEKQKEIESLATDLQEALTLIKEGRELVCLNNKVLEHSHQDKISFAVEQIIKTKETLIKFLQDEGFYENEWYDLFETIDNQIKQLKEMK